MVKGWKSGASWGFPKGKARPLVASAPLVSTRLQVNKGEHDAHCAAREARLPPAAASSSHASRRFMKRLGLTSPRSSRRRTMWRPSSSSSNSEPSSSSFPGYRRRSAVASALRVMLTSRPTRRRASRRRLARRLAPSPGTGCPTCRRLGQAYMRQSVLVVLTRVSSTWAHTVGRVS